MALIDDIWGMADSIGAELKEKKGAYTLTLVVAERKAFLSKKKLEYVARFRVDDSARELKSTEMLKETGSGISSGDDVSPQGLGSRPRRKRREQTHGRAASRSDLTTLASNILTATTGAIRTRIEQAAQASGYSFSYSITGWKI
jgi:hypothetical protein